MKTAEPCDGRDTSNCLHWSMERSNLIKCKVRACAVVVGTIFLQQMAKVTFAEHHDVVETLASDRSDQPFNVTVLPRRARRDRSVSNAHGPQSTGDRSAIRRVTVSDEIARSFVPRKCLSDLLGNPLGGWMCGDIGPKNGVAMVCISCLDLSGTPSHLRYHTCYGGCASTCRRTYPFWSDCGRPGTRSCMTTGYARPWVRTTTQALCMRPSRHAWKSHTRRGR
jgi:hypothetical protein